MPIEIKVDKEYDGQKPKNFLKKKVDIPFFKVVDYIRDKRIKLNGKKIKKEDILRQGDIITLWGDDIKLREITKYQVNMKNLNLEHIYENEDFLILNKESNIVVQGAQHDNVALSLHLAWHKDKIGDKSDFEYFHAHRIDKDTSGIVVVAKNPVAIRKLNEIFREREVVKKYICLCVGEIFKKEGKIEILMKKNPEGSREKMSIVKQTGKDIKQSLSYYKVLKEIEHNGDIFSLIEVEIKTGITHQIRVHMKHLGTPILGDKMYGNSTINTKYENKLNRQFLHASHIEFDYDNKHYSFDAKLTKDLQEFLEYLEK